MIKTWQERCEEHPDHQTGMVSNQMIQARMQEEIDALRAALAEPEQRCEYIRSSGTTHWCALAEPEQDWSLLEATQESLREHMARIKELEAKLKDKNHA